jgi:septal ring factor EnvC (AmiA/AmiB activator)
MLDDEDTVDGKPLDEVESEVEETKEPAEKKVENEKWDKTRQQLDQLKSAQKRIAEERDSLAEQMDAQRAEVAQLREQLKVNQAKKIEIQELDPDDADVPKIVNQNKALIAELSKTSERLATLENLASRLQNQEYKTAEDKRRESVAEEVLSSLDEEFGSKYRTAAKKMADNLVDIGESEQPKTQMQAYKLVRKCYLELSSKDKRSTTKKVSSDNGAGTVPVSSDDIKEGSRQDVLAQLRKKFK